MFKKLGILLAIILVSVISLIAGVAYFSYPSYTGTVTINRKGYSNITIRREELGIPHIKGDTIFDTLYGLGWVQAQDRSFQMHMKRMAAAGRLSEIAGMETIKTDRFFRSLGLRRTADKQAALVKGDARRFIQSYCDGVNDYMQSLSVLPLEFHLVGSRWENWTISDTYMFQGLINLFLSLDFLFEPFKSMVNDKYGEDFARKVFGAGSEYLFDNTTILDDDDLIKSGIFSNYSSWKKNSSSKSKEKLQIPDYVIEDFNRLSKLEFLEQNYYSMKGSNNWVVSGSLTDSGYPILANDPHLDVVIPSFWYQVELLYQHKGKERFVIGSVMPGMCIMACGRNDYVSWGITNNMVDASDLYLVEIVNKTHYFYEDKLVPLKIVYEKIKIKGFEEEEVLEVHQTHHGPVLDNLFDIGKPKNPFDFKSLAFSWVGFLVEDHSYESSMGFFLADSLENFQYHLKMYTGPVLNLLYATTDQHIGYYSIGLLPVRNDPTNIFVLDGSKKENNWQRFYSQQEQPRVTDPAKGYIVTANNKLATDNLVNHISVTQSTHCRSTRITNQIKKFISEKKKFNSEIMKNMQLDLVDEFCVKTHSQILSIFEKNKEQFSRFWENEKIEKVQKMWGKWNCEIKGNSSQAALYAVWENYFVLKLLTETTNNSYYNQRIVMNLMFDHIVFNSILEWAQGKSLWDQLCLNKENRLYPEVSPCLYNFFQAFVEAYEFLELKQGNDNLKWQYKKLIEHVFVHTPFSETPLRIFFERKAQAQGNRRTINVGGINLIKNVWRSFYSANLRCVMDMKPNSTNYYIIDTGISENPFNPHYIDQMQTFQKGKYIEMRFGHNRFHEYQTIQQINFSEQKQTTKNEI